ncbi:MAG: sugar transferase [Verrucomicrobiota bacterium]
MLGRKQEINLQLNQIIDAALVAIAFVICHSIRFRFDFGQGPIAPLKDFIWLGAIIVPFTPIALEIQGYYRHPLQKTVITSIRQVFGAVLGLGLMVGAVVVFVKTVEQSRFVFLTLPAVVMVFLLTKEAVVKAIIRRRLSDKGIREQVIVAGVPEDVAAMLSSIPVEQRMEFDVVQEIDISRQPVVDLVKAFQKHNAQRVLFAAGHVHFNRVEEAIKACETEGVEAWLSAGFIRTSITRPNFDSVGGIPMLVFQSTPEASWALMFKNLFDRAGALVLLILTAWIWGIAAIGIRFSSKGPVIFKQMRGGRYGRPFRMYKFRTMHIGAEEERASLEEQNEMTGPVFKLEKDPRVFKFGSLLRHLSIDELPQLINVLRGEMSLVGPRPLPIYEVERIVKSAQRRRLSVKPGMTCLWQVRGRNRITSFDDWVSLDLEYIDNWSMWLDFKILLKTIPVVLFGAGAR